MSDCSPRLRRLSALVACVITFLVVAATSHASEGAPAAAPAQPPAAGAVTDRPAHTPPAVVAPPPMPSSAKYPAPTDTQTGYPPVGSAGPPQPAPQGDDKGDDEPGGRTHGVLGGGGLPPAGLPAGSGAPASTAPSAFAPSAIGATLTRRRRTAGVPGSTPTTVAESAAFFSNTTGSSPAWRTIAGLSLVLLVPLAALLFVRRHPEKFRRPVPGA